MTAAAERVGAAMQLRNPGSTRESASLRMTMPAPQIDTHRLLAVARGDEPADLLLRNGRLVNVFSGEIEPADIALAGNRIAGIGPGYDGRETIDLAGSYVSPGLIDAHVHIESSLCVPAQFAAAVVPRGVTTAVADPHEIANVAGVAGIRFMAEASRDLPLSVVLMGPSCVPATEMATVGAALDAAQLDALRRDGLVHGLAEVMNFPAVIAGDEKMLAKLRAFAGRPRDGHAPGVLGRRLNAYVACGIGSDHECVSLDEASQKLARGMYLLIREATNAHNLRPLLPLITPANSRRICFCTDDRQPADLLTHGGIDFMLREAISFGIDPVDAIRMCTLNAAEWFGLHDRGAVAPGRRADLVVFDDLRDPRARLVYASGTLAAQDGRLLAPLPAAPPTAPAVRIAAKVDWSAIRLDVPARSTRMCVIGAIADQLVTDRLELPVTTDSGGRAVADPARDVLKIAVIERHRGTGNVGIGFIRGFGLQRGAIAGTVAHDHHNLVVIGCDDRSMLSAATATGGAGLAVADADRVLAQLPLPIAGLMSDAPIHVVRDQYERLLNAARSLGASPHDPFMAMSFMALEVIPRLKLTDRGLVDVETFAFTDLFV